VAAGPRPGKASGPGAGTRIAAMADDAVDSQEQLSIQERLYPGLTCFGCGHANAAGLRLRSYPGEDGVTATFVPRPEHDNSLGYLNGGIISTVLDCHSAAAVFLEAERRGWSAPDDAALPYVTAGLDVRFLRPTPLAEPLHLVATVAVAGRAKMTVAVELHWGGKPRATGTARWKRWRSRRPAGGH
jgi:acyl-coenzyme A thioesterase PaaI-like protein